MARTTQAVRKVFPADTESDGEPEEEEVITEGEEQEETTHDDPSDEVEDPDYGIYDAFRPDSFPSPFYFLDRNPYTLVELRMRLFSGNIRSKPNWWEKVHDASIVAKWREEMIEQDRILVERLWGGEERLVNWEDGAKKWPRERITLAQLDYIFQELKYEAARRDPGTGIFVSVHI